VALGSPPINTLPSGLLHLLGIKSGGQYPRDLASTLAPVLDLTDWYGVAHDETVTSNNVLTATGSNTLTNGSVPNNELWFVRQVTFRVVVGAAEAIAIEPAWMQDPNGTLPQIIGSERVLPASTTASCFMSIVPFFATPGSSVRAVVNSITGSIDVALAMRVSRFEI
jgi:hypothetical protein